MTFHSITFFKPEEFFSYFFFALICFINMTRVFYNYILFLTKIFHYLCSPFNFFNVVSIILEDIWSHCWKEIFKNFFHFRFILSSYSLTHFIFDLLNDYFEWLRGKSIRINLKVPEMCEGLRRTKEQEALLIGNFFFEVLDYRLGFFLISFEHSSKGAIILKYSFDYKTKSSFSKEKVDIII